MVLVDLDETAAQATAHALGANAFSVVADIRDETAARHAVSAARERFGALHGLVNCAGVAGGEKVLGRNGPHSLDSFSRIVGINLIGSFNMLRLAAEAMAENAPDEARRARRDHQYGLDRRLRRADRPDRLCRVQGRRGQPDIAGRPRAGALRHPGDDHRPGVLETPMMAGMTRNPRLAGRRAVPATSGASGRIRRAGAAHLREQHAQRRGDPPRRCLRMAAKMKQR